MPIFINLTGAHRRNPAPKEATSTVCVSRLFSPGGAMNERGALGSSKTKQRAKN